LNNMASDTGLYVTVVGISSRQYWPLLYEQRLQVFIAGFYVDYPDPDDFLVGYASMNGFYPISMGYSNPDVTDLVRKQTLISDSNERLGVISQIEHMVNEDWAYLLLNYGVSFSISRSWIHERANASVASGVEAYNPVMQGFYLSELQKGGSSTSQSLLPTFLAQLQLPAMVFSSKKVF
jgi:ABC-type transport system substrate-binding protein